MQSTRCCELANLDELYLEDFGYNFAQKSIDTLIDNFNKEVGSRAGTHARLAFNLVNIEELKRRGIDVSAVYDETTIVFAHKVRLDDTGTKLVLIEK